MFKSVIATELWTLFLILLCQALCMFKIWLFRIIMLFSLYFVCDKFLKSNKIYEYFEDETVDFTGEA